MARRLKTMDILNFWKVSGMIKVKFSKRQKFCFEHCELSNKEIASKLGTNDKSVEGSFRQIYLKLGMTKTHRTGSLRYVLTQNKGLINAI